MDWNDFFTYEPETGNLIWKVRPREHFISQRAMSIWNARYSGKVAGHEQGLGSGRARYIRVFDKMHRAHRIIHEMMIGPIAPGMVVDHKNGDYFDNRLGNI